MRDKQESIIIFRAACLAGLSVSAAIAAGGAFIDFTNQFFDADAPSVLPDAALLALQGLPAWITLFSLFGLGAHFYLKRHNMTQEIHYILAAMLGVYAPFVAASFLVGPGDGPLMALAGGVPVSLVAGFPLGMIFRRMVIMPRSEAARRYAVGTSYFARLPH